jgi:N-acetylmuramoyl-L-alanine amidase
LATAGQRAYRRAAGLTVLALLFSAGPARPAGPAPFTVLTSSQRREIVPVAGRGDVPLAPIDQVVAGFGVTVTTDAAGGAATLVRGKREVALYNKKSLASVDGDLRLLSAPVVLDQGRWLVPVDSLPRLLEPLLETRVEWRAVPRVLVVGEVSIPRITVSTFVSGEAARVVLEATEKVPFEVQQAEGRITVAVRRDLLDVAFQEQRLAGGIVESVQFLGGRDNLFVVNLGRRFQRLRATEQDAPARLVLELEGPPAPAVRAAPPSPGAAGVPSGAPSPPSGAAGPGPRPIAAPPPEAELRTIVIDPGHGGEEVGAKGPGGTLEKDVTLAISRKLRGMLVNNLGLQVFLTREGDDEVPLDQRTAIANNYKADLFVSIHANASRAHGAKGSEVYFLSYQASDDEGRRMAQVEGEAVPRSAAAPGSDLALILWDMAQAEHLEESSTLASRIQEELAVVTGSQGRGVKQAPFRVLVGAAMPAVLVEVSFISNPEEEKLLASDAFQTKVASAVLRGLARFEQERAQRYSFATPKGRPASTP